jgi:DNA gyrase subunit B
MVLSRLEKRGFHKELIETLIQNGVKDKRFLQDIKKLNQIKQILEKKDYVTRDIVLNEDYNLYEMKVKPPRKNEEISNGEPREVIIGRGLIFSNNFQHAVILGQKVLKYDHPSFVVYEKGKPNGEVQIEDKHNLLFYMMNEGKRGIAVQRYKGLGEMNPEQLWKTTMDPTHRTLLRVKVEDVVETDEIFTVLMGDEVEPRRDFIQTNALEVSTLDV